MATKTEKNRFQELETLLKDAREEADNLRRELTRMQNVLVSTRLIMGHELKKPTTAISGYLDLALEEVEEGNELNECLVKARNECQLLNELNLFFIELLRLDHAHDDVNGRRTNVVDIVNECIRRAPASLSAKTRVAISPTEDTIDFFVNTDALQIILSNLIENALSYTPNGVTVELERSRDKRGLGTRNLLMVRVCDSGKGIPKAYLHKIFNPFVRIPNDDGPEGSGLGLTLVRSLVELCDGSVYVDSCNTSGMTVHVTLPELAERGPTVD